MAVAFDATLLYREPAESKKSAVRRQELEFRSQKLQEFRRRTASRRLLLSHGFLWGQLTTVDEIEQLREEAWIGDAVLALFVRDWLLTVSSREMSVAQHTAMFELFVSNQFLSSFGEPTRIEAEIGRAYQTHGLSAAFESIEKNLLPRFLKTARKRGYRVEAERKNR